MTGMTRRGFLRLSAATTAGLWLAACAPIQAPTPAPQAPMPAVSEPVEVSLLAAEQTTRVEKVIQFVMDSDYVPGLGVGIVKDGQVIHAKGYGVTKVDTEQPVTTQSIFRVMDLTHLFTAAAAMQLVEQGKLALDTPVVEYLPYFKLNDERGSRITVRHLLSETAGLPATPEGKPELDWQGKQRQTDDGALERYVRSLEGVALTREPGTGRVFCNMGYDIAGAVITQVSGEIFEDYMARQILQPLGMTSSTFYPEQVDPERLTSPHVLTGSAAVVSDLVTHSRERAPSVGLFTTVTDLNRWMMANLNRGELEGTRILQSSSYDEVWGTSIDLYNEGEFEAEGLGWLLGTSSGGRPVCHYWGNDVGYHAACYLFPEQKVGAVALGNLFTAAGLTSFYAYNAASTIIGFALT